MDLTEFRQTGHRLVDWMTDYLANVESFPVRAQVAPGEVARQLPDAAPEEAEPMESILADFENVILPGMTHWQHPRFFAYFPANSSPPSVLAEMLTATLAAQCMSWETSPAATELETVVVSWLRRLMGLPSQFVGSIHDTASTANLVALLIARERATSFECNERGNSNRPPLTVYCSSEAHSSVEKAAKIAGIGRRYLRKVGTDSLGGIDTKRLETAIERDRESGLLPVCVTACLGTTGSSGFDSLAEVGRIAGRFGLWFHVDAAWAGSALLLDEYRWMIDGIELVDSLVFNPHKWLLTNFDCSVFFVRHERALLDTLALTPEYLRTKEDDCVVNYRDWGIQLGRRFRALKLWFVLRRYGAAGLRTMLRRHIALAHDLATRVDETPDFELVTTPVLSLFCFRYHPEGLPPERLDALNETLLAKLNDTGEVYLTHTRLNDRFVIRFVVGQSRTEEKHVNRAWEVIQKTARALGERQDPQGAG